MLYYISYLTAKHFLPNGKSFLTTREKYSYVAAKLFQREGKSFAFAAAISTLALMFCWPAAEKLFGVNTKNIALVLYRNDIEF